MDWPVNMPDHDNVRRMNRARHMPQLAHHKGSEGIGIAGHITHDLTVSA
jgi:hypothetical protein